MGASREQVLEQIQLLKELEPLPFHVSEVNRKIFKLYLDALEAISKDQPELVMFEIDDIDHDGVMAVAMAMTRFKVWLQDPAQGTLRAAWDKLLVYSAEQYKKVASATHA